VPLLSTRSTARRRLRLGRAVVAGGEVEPRGADAHLVDQRQRAAEMLGARELPQDDRPVGADHRVARRVLQRPDLHVGAVGRVADVDRVEEQRRRDVARLELGPEAAEPVGAHRRDVDVRGGSGGVFHVFHRRLPGAGGARLRR